MLLPHAYVVNLSNLFLYQLIFAYSPCTSYGHTLVLSCNSVMMIHQYDQLPRKACRAQHGDRCCKNGMAHQNTL